MHLDTTSFVLYENDCETGSTPAYGYSKASRPDLKQVMLSLTKGGAANTPLWMEALDGNSSDKVNFQDTVRKIQSFTKKLSAADEAICFVVDAAFFTPKKLAELEDVLWITRVPAKLKDARTILNKPHSDLSWQVIDDNYRLVEICKTVHGLQQRWLLIESSHAANRELKRFSAVLIKKQSRLKSNFGT